MLLSVRDTNPGHLFNFYCNNRIHAGLRYRQILYGLVYKCSEVSKLTAYQCACELAEQTSSVLIAAHQGEYTVWLKLDARFSHYWKNIDCFLDNTQSLSSDVEDSLQLA